MRSGTLFAYFVTFTASFCMMVIELVAGRILAPHIGQHLYSWTSIIGVCLAGISVGAILGGWLADKFPYRSTLGWFLFLAGLFSLAIPFMTDQICNTNFFYLLKERSVTLMTRIVIYTATIFLPATLVLGMISPMVIKLIVRNLENAGTIVGRIYSFSTIGSILGTFATGFFLIEEFGTRVLLYAVGGLLIVIAPLAGGLFYSATKYVGGILLLLAVGLLGVGLFVPGKYAQAREFLSETVGQPMFYYYDAPEEEKEKNEKEKNEKEQPKGLFARLKEGNISFPMRNMEYYKESSYYTLRVKSRFNEDDHHINDLILDNLIHSHTDLADPDYLAYDYLRIYEELVGWQLERKGTTKHRELFIGGGGYTMQRYFHTKFKDSYIDVAEIDPAVTMVAEKFMAAPRDERLVTSNEDGRLFVMKKQNSDTKYDFIFGDAFNDLSIPFHLTTLEFDQQMKNLLTPNGLVMSLVIDQVGQGLFLPSFIATMRKAFGDENVVLVIIENPNGRKRLVEYLKKRNLDKYIDRLSKEKLDGVVKDIFAEHLKAKQKQDWANRLAGESTDQVIKELLADYLTKKKLAEEVKKLDKESWEEVLKGLKPEKQEDETINMLRRIAYLKRMKVDETAPYLKPTDLDYIPHSTVIVVGSASKQDWGDFEHYLNDFEAKTKKKGVSHVIRPEKLTEYLNSRMRDPGVIEKLYKGKDRLPWTPVILTDDYAPVDNLTAPVFEKKYGYKKSNRSANRQDEEDFIDDVLDDIK